MVEYTVELGHVLPEGFRVLENEVVASASLDEVIIISVKRLATRGHTIGASAVRLVDNDGKFIWQHINV